METRGDKVTVVTIQIATIGALTNKSETSTQHGGVDGIARTGEEDDKTERQQQTQMGGPAERPNRRVLWQILAGRLQDSRAAA